MTKTDRPAFDEVSAWARYDPASGRFFRIADASNGERAGDELSGTVNTGGYLMINYRGRPIVASRLAFLLMTGEWPQQLIDHKNGIKIANHWDNLREATPSQNNSHKKQKVGPAGYVGVTIHPGNKTNPYVARIGINHKRIHLGFFASAEEAAAAYRRASKDLHGEFASRHL